MQAVSVMVEVITIRRMVDARVLWSNYQGPGRNHTLEVQPVMNANISTRGDIITTFRGNTNDEEIFSHLHSDLHSFFFFDERLSLKKKNHSIYRKMTLIKNAFFKKTFNFH